MFYSYIKLLRVNHWFKNIFIVPGVFLAIILRNDFSISLNKILSILVAFILTSMISSVNYIINQIADVKFDAKHPVKKYRPLPSGEISFLQAKSLATVLWMVSLITAYYTFNINFFYTLLVLWIAGVVYNIKPVRLKNIPYIDVISESFNNPLRFLLGWFVVVKSEFPHPMVLLFTWSIGAVFMTAKRYDELKYYGKKLVPYRYTFNTYSLKSLLVMMYVYVSISTSSILYLVYKYQRSLLMGIPFVLVFLLWVVKEVKSGNAKTRDVESFVFNYRFVLYVSMILLLFVFLYFFNQRL